MGKFLTGIGRRSLVLLVLALLAWGVIAALSDWPAVWQAVLRARWPIMLATAALAVFSNFATSYSFALVAKLFEVNMSRVQLIQIGFVANALNQLASPAGTAGLALKAVIARRRGAHVANMMTSSLAHSELTNGMLFLLVPVGLLSVLASGAISTREAQFIAMTAALLFVIAFISVYVTVNKRARNAMFRGIVEAVRRVLKRDVARQMADLEESIDRGFRRIVEQPVRSLGIMAVVALDWTSDIGVVWLCFYAFGETLPVGVLITGVSVGMTLGLLTMIPGGAGVQDAAMVGVFSLAGVPLETTILSLLLFRATYYLLPFALSWPLYGRFLRPVRRPHVSKAV
ncbi:MAG: flippase-like domain-containing protein [SAR202 cluster bacterium]|nr:flippase-like domain-containing protein [SAR202 cluster bacterium]